MEPSAVSSASVPLSAGCQDGYDCRLQCLSVVYTVSDTLSEGFISLLPPFPVSFTQYRCALALNHAHSRVRRPPPHSRCFPTPPLPAPSLLPLPTLVASPDLRCTPPPLLPLHIADASSRRHWLPPPFPPRHTKSAAATDPPQHPPPDTEGPQAARTRAGVAATDRPLGQRSAAGAAAAAGAAPYGEEAASGGGGASGAGRAQGRGARTGAAAAPVRGWRRAAGAATGGEMSGAGQLASGKGSLRAGARPGSVCDPEEHAGARYHTLSSDAHIHRTAIVSSRPGISRNVTGALIIVVSLSPQSI